MKNIKIIILLILCCSALNSCNTASWKGKEKFTVSLNSPHIKIGEIEPQFSAFMSFGSLKKDKIDIFYFPREDAVCLRYRRDFITFNQFWDYGGRQTFITALERYNTDYNSRDLIIKSRRTNRIYGVTEGFLIWQMSNFTVQARANMNASFGYQFNNRAPYFIITQHEAVYKEEYSADDNRKSSAITIYFTRAQAAQLAALFDQSFLQGFASRDRNTERKSDADRDSYFD